ncbi:MAG: hypothetical protein H7Y38_08010 [Armatimonadetes bacterium]|nr:hypothetical protein [Armatimonadota bacterium]
MNLTNRCFCLTALLLTVSLPVHAQSLSASVEGGGFFSVYGQTPDIIDLSDRQVIDPAQNGDAAFANGKDYSYSARASAGFGWLRAAAISESQSFTNGYMQGFAEGRGEWADTLLFTPTDPALIGTTGSFSSTLITGGIMLVNSSFLADASASVIVGVEWESGTNITTFQRYQSVSSVGGIETPPEGDLSLLLNMEVPFIWGLPSTVRTILRVAASSATSEGSNAQSGRSSADYGNTSTWGGISQVRESVGGAATTAYSLSSGSGANYRNAITAPAVVPESSSVTLLAVTAVGATLIRRRYRRKR